MNSRERVACPLSRGSREEVSEAVAALIRDVSVGGGHLLSSGNTIAASLHPENYRAMLLAARARGGHLEPSLPVCG